MASNVAVAVVLGSLLALWSCSVFAALPDSDTTFEDNDKHLVNQLHLLNSNLALLESRVDERVHELKLKDENIEQLESIIQEKSTSVNSLKNQVKSLQEGGSLDAKYKLVEATVRAGDLEKQVDSLKKELETQTKRKAVLESRANLAEKKIQDLNHKLENLQRINVEQKNRILKTEHAIQVAEEEMVKAKSEVADFSKEVREVHESWIPPWLTVHLANSRTSLITLWNEHARPALEKTSQTALDKKVEFEYWLAPHIEIVKTHWAPTVKEMWSAFVTNIGPNVQLLAEKTVEIYYSSKEIIGPHVAVVQKAIDSYLKEVEQFSRPYVNLVSTTVKPHVDKAQVIFKPYTKKVLRGYRKFMKAVAVYHRQVRAVIQEFLQSHDITKAVATKEIVWYMASALMTLPVVIIFNYISAIFSKKPKKRARHSHSNHTRRRAKRAHSDK
ncbi:hypothetical protein DCAR_0522645 [Daucus carota subsp. sativus]|uniref:Uncharacterized protein n=1 Tax=Daucus carota subsp. sativus TaxID=79200 RepID=A0AAF0XAA8_DAUCS|nr:PREDICTED: uncharacterized protein LOC108222891 [Daucus carota subsp. sativus]WOH03249.1 hypothetical protein DCAR_0522645 [Daucus carota subsp. sativus]